MVDVEETGSILKSERLRKCIWRDKDREMITEEIIRTTGRVRIVIGIETEGVIAVKKGGIM